ncbi:hypothetical protein C8R44DRAFT_881330 [Mycena epipterygia]|nr:hypothetical protein C8R44DRAFT_881330 [Mycena epipterygia]
MAVSIAVFLLTGMQTSGWNTLLLPTVSTYDTDVNGRELDLTSPRLRSMLTSGEIDFCVSNSSDLVALSVGQTGSGFAALNGDLDFPTSLTLMDNLFNTSTGGILPVAFRYANVSAWFPDATSIPAALTAPSIGLNNEHHHLNALFVLLVAKFALAAAPNGRRQSIVDLAKDSVNTSLTISNSCDNHSSADQRMYWFNHSLFNRDEHRYHYFDVDGHHYLDFHGLLHGYGDGDGYIYFDGDGYNDGYNYFDREHLHHYHGDTNHDVNQYEYGNTNHDANQHKYFNINTSIHDNEHLRLRHCNAGYLVDVPRMLY